MKKEEVLVIDDNETTIDIVKIILEEEGYTVSSCPNGKSALQLTENKSFGIYIVDYSLSEQMKGDAVTAELRKLFPNSFIIGCSIEPKEKIFLAAGADKFLIKYRLHKELIQLIKERKH